MEKLFLNTENKGFFTNETLQETKSVSLSIVDIAKNVSVAPWVDAGTFSEKHGLFLDDVFAKLKKVVAKHSPTESFIIQGLEEGILKEIKTAIEKCYGSVEGENGETFTPEMIVAIYKQTILKAIAKNYELVVVNPSATTEPEFVAGDIVKFNGDICEMRKIGSITVPCRFNFQYNEMPTKKELKDYGKIAIENKNKYGHLRPYLYQIDEGFKMNREEYDDFLRLFSTPGFSIVLLTGNPGVGKSELVQQVCARMVLPLIRVDFSGETTAEQFLWRTNFNPESKRLEVEEGILPFCIRNGIKLVLEEFSAIPPSVAFELHRVFEKGELFIKDSGEVIKPHPMFSVILTDNRIGNRNFQKFLGTQNQNQALLSRIFYNIWIDYPTKAFEKSYLFDRFSKLKELELVNTHSSSGSKKLFIDCLIDFANDIRNKYIAGDLSFTISPRDVIYFLNTYFILKDVTKAFQYAILNFNRQFKTDEDVIFEVFKKYFGDKPVIEDSSVKSEAKSLIENLNF